MNIRELTDKLNLNIISGDEGLSREIKGCYVSDLLSDVVGHANSGDIWITLQTHINIVAVASLKDLAGIILVKDLSPNENTINKSNELGIPVIQTSMSAFEITGKIYNLLNR